MVHNSENVEQGLFVALEHPEALKEPEELLKAYFNSTNIGLCIFDSEFRYLAINRTLAAINGLPVEAHLGKTVRNVLGDFADSLEPKFRQALETKKPIHFEVSGTLPSGTETSHWIVHYLPVQPSGQLARVGAIVLDVTAQKGMEASLQRIGGTAAAGDKPTSGAEGCGSLLSRHRDVSEAFPKISARIRRVLRQEFASLAIRDESTDRLVQHLTDFPLSKGLMPAQFGTGNSPQGQALQAREALMFTQKQLGEFENESAKGLLAEGLQSLCCVPLMRPKGPVELLSWKHTPHGFETRRSGTDQPGSSAAGDSD